MDRPGSVPVPCKLERYFDKYEFSVKYLLCCSDPEAMSMRELLDMADDECRALWDNLSLGYTQSAGHPLLLKEIADLYEGVNQQQVLAIVPQEGIYIAMHCLVEHLEEKHSLQRLHVISTYPAYQSLYENVRTLGCDLSLWTAELDERSRTWTFDLNKLKAMIRDDTKLLVVNFPHNPTGYVPNEERWQEIVDLCKVKGIFLFSDEMYRFTNNDGSQPLPSGCTLYRDAVTLCGLSKTFGLPGLRIGWLCTQNEVLMESMKSFKDYTTICQSAPSEVLAIVALRNREKIVQRTVSTLKANLTLLETFFQRFPQYFTWAAPKAGTTGFLQLRKELLNSGGATEFCDTLLKETGILLVPGSLFEFKDVFVRLGFGRKSLPEVLEVLGAYLDTLAG